MREEIEYLRERLDELEEHVEDNEGSIATLMSEQEDIRYEHELLTQKLLELEERSNQQEE